MTEDPPGKRVLRVPLSELRGGELKLPPEAVRYVTRVHRLKPGDRFVAFDPVAQLEAEAELLGALVGRAAPHGPASGGAQPESRSAVWVRLAEPRPCTVRPARSVTLIQAMSKGSKFDAIVRDATELGATRIVPCVSERSVKRGSSSAQAERWQRVAIEAARQCGRGELPAVEPSLELGEALAQHRPESTGALGVCLDPAAPAPLRHELVGLDETRAVVVVVGPEGGLSTAELEQAERLGYHRVHLGGFVLRTETVCAAVLGAIAALS